MFRKYLLACAIGMVAIAAILGGADALQQHPTQPTVAVAFVDPPFTCPERWPNDKARDAAVKRWVAAMKRVVDADFTNAEMANAWRQRLIDHDCAFAGMGN